MSLMLLLSIIPQIRPSEVYNLAAQSHVKVWSTKLHPLSKIIIMFVKPGLLPIPVGITQPTGFHIESVDLSGGNGLCIFSMFVLLVAMFLITLP